MIVVAPSSVQEMIDLTIKGFDLADKYRMPCMLLADGTIGQMMEPVVMDRVQPEVIAKPWAVTGCDGSRPRNIVNSLFIQPDDLEQLVLERYRRYAVVEEKEPLCEEYLTEDADIVLVAFGVAARVCKNAIKAARAKGIKVGLLRPITLWPYPKKPLAKLAETAKSFISVELSMGQMIEDVELAIRCKRPVHLCSRTGGMIPSPAEVLATIEQAVKEDL